MLLTLALPLCSEVYLRTRQLILLMLFYNETMLFAATLMTEVATRIKTGTYCAVLLATF